MLRKYALLAVLGLLPVVTTAAETVLICHGENVPESWKDKYKKDVGSALLEAVFDTLFERGAIAFDTPYPDLGTDPAPAWLKAASKRFGAESTLYFQTYWKDGKDAMSLDKVTYIRLDALGQVLAQGTLRLDFVWPSPPNGKALKALCENLVKAFKFDAQH